MMSHRGLGLELKAINRRKPERNQGRGSELSCQTTIEGAVLSTHSRQTRSSFEQYSEAWHGVLSAGDPKLVGIWSRTSTALPVGGADYGGAGGAYASTRLHPSFLAA